MAINLKKFSQEIKEFMEWSKQEQEIVQTTLNSLNDNLHEISTKLPVEVGKQWLPLVTENSLEDTRMCVESENSDNSNTETCTNRTPTLIVFSNHSDDSNEINSHCFRNCASSLETKFAGSQDVLSPSATVVNKKPGQPYSILRKQHTNTENLLLKKNSEEGRKKIRLIKSSCFQSPSKKIKK